MSSMRDLLSTLLEWAEEDWLDDAWQDIVRTIKTRGYAIVKVDDGVPDDWDQYMLNRAIERGCIIELTPKGNYKIRQGEFIL